MKVLLGFILGIGVQIWKGFILTLMWGWFIAPKFGLPRLGLVEAAGVSMVINFFLSDLAAAQVWAYVEQNMDEVQKSNMPILKPIVVGAIVFPICLLSAYVWHLFQ